MGFSLSGSHVIFFIASVIIAGTISGIFIAITMDIGSDMTERGNRIQEQLDTDFKIINDPDNIPTSGSDYVFYLKNIGGCTLSTSTDIFQVFVDGELITSGNYAFGDTSIGVADVTELTIDTGQIDAGDHTLRVVGPCAIADLSLIHI